MGPIGVTGSDAANRLAAEADLVLAVGTRLQDFTTGSWTVFRNEDLRIVAVNAARFDAVKHRALAARRATPARRWPSCDRLVEGVGGAGVVGRDGPSAEAADHRELVEKATAAGDAAGLPTYAQVVGAVNRLATEDDYVVAAAGGLPGELNVNWTPGASARSTASTASRAWATRSPAAGARAWRAPRATSSPSSATARTS